MKRFLPRSRTSRALAAAVLLATIGVLALLPCGCEELFGGPARPKGFLNLGTDTVLILPFATPNRKYYESEVGKAFSLIIVDLVREGCRMAKVLDYDALTAAVPGQDIAQVPFPDLGQSVGARYVVVGEVHELRGKDPKSFGVFRGKMVISARVIDVRTAAVAWRLTQQEYYYPRLAIGESIPAPIDDEEEVVRRVMREAAWGVAAVFRGSRSREEIRLQE
ncbi:MAG: hypothetical protein FJ290_12670 [Planctomycetes bacterium]|nr:hypothetical protein [Planctomycetota bacterium]